jgi:hypothetical protein
MQGVLHEADTFGPGEIEEGRNIAREAGVSGVVADDDLAKLFRHYSQQGARVSPAAPAAPATESSPAAPAYLVEKEHNRVINAQVRKAGVILKTLAGSEQYDGWNLYELVGTWTKVRAGMSCEKNKKPALAQLELRRRAALEVVEVVNLAKKTGAWANLLGRMVRYVQARGGCWETTP